MIWGFQDLFQAEETMAELEPASERLLKISCAESPLAARRPADRHSKPDGPDPELTEPRQLLTPTGHSAASARQLRPHKILDFVESELVQTPSGFGSPEFGKVLTA
ncbi:hypothetical protein PoB_002655900 [Plakobranchus ocellatus]|uniref:Uncharacterized protein n=1 Tax=Plakobranchus ocellatus TaxID=259542 RepID=A0AAV4A0D3_9GAST|nr:hypothetical protein PoB_002655900 [Plakobranchus ocellatus]